MVKYLPAAYLPALQRRDSVRESICSYRVEQKLKADLRKGLFMLANALGRLRGLATGNSQHESARIVLAISAFCPPTS